MNTSPPEYPSFAALAQVHVEGRDFKRIVKRKESARVAIIAPHGGRIEPRTDSIAAELAGEEFSLYCFCSLLPKSKANLHITSHRFDDPLCLDLAEQHEFVVAMHGWSQDGEAILIGGLDRELAAQFAKEAMALGVTTHTNGKGLAGTQPLNICNRGKTGRGVQLELTMSLRKSQNLQPLLLAFRKVLLECQNVA